jgi:lysophospholipase
MVASGRQVVSDGKMGRKIMPSEQIATAQTLVRDIEIRSVDGITLRGRWWRRQAPRGVVIVSHGFAEHGGCYRRVAEALGARLEFDVIAVDYRGHGMSPGRRGVVKRYDDLVGDLSSVVAWTARQLPGLPRFVLAHSNGGQVALRLALHGKSSIEGMVVSNPALRVAVPIAPGKLKLGRLLARVAPWVTLPGDGRTGVLTRDPEIQEEHRTDPWRHNRMSPPLFFGMVAGGELLMARAAEIRVPLLMFLGGQDTVIDPTTSREFFDRLGSDDKTLLIYPKMLHEPLNELGREQVFDDLIRWLDQHLPAQ